MKYRTFIIVSSISYMLFIAANFLSWQHPTIGKEAVFGKEVWQKYNCVSCHTIFGNGGYVGGDLTNITLQRSKNELIDFFRDPPVIPPNKEVKHIGLTRKESESVISISNTSVPSLP